MVSSRSRLAAFRQTPPSFDNAADAGLAWGDVVARHLALLDVHSAIRAAYAADADPIAHFGLPMASQDYGNVSVVRAQRAVFQQWKADVPWARARQVVVAKGGDVAKEDGMYPDLATTPQIAPGSTMDVRFAGPQVQSLLVGPGTPGRLYALQTWWTAAETARLLTSDDLDATWRPFGGGLPVDPACVRNVNLDDATADALYASTCRGLDRWDGSRCAQVSSLATLSVAVAYGKPSALLAVAPGPRSDVVVMRSDDGGQVSHQ